MLESREVNELNSKGQAGFIIILILIVVALVFIYPMGGGKNIADLQEKIDKLSCPDVDTNITCELGVQVFTDSRGCVRTECRKANTSIGALPETGTLQVFFLDVGEGDGIYIETPQEQKIIIDTGKGTDMTDFLVMRKVQKIDWLITTHPDADHIGGVDEVLESFVVSNYVAPNLSCDTETCGAIERLIPKEEGMTRLEGYSKMQFKGLDLSWTVLNPNPGLDFTDDNDESMIIKLEYGDVKILFTGDCSEECEEMMLLLGKNLSADILKVGHHGSDTATSAAFLAEVNPAYAILSFGDTNPYRHPSKEVVDRLVARNIKIVKTATAGNIELRTDGKRLEWHCEIKGDCFE